LDQSGDQAPGPSATTLVTVPIACSGTSVTIEIAEDGLRGGVAGSQLTTNLPIQVVIPCEGECLKSTAPGYQRWKDAGSPDCWCFIRQCHGDIDGAINGPFHVGLTDLNDLLVYLNKFEHELALQPGYPYLPFSGLDFNCADLNHLADGPFRVGLVDLNALLFDLNDFNPPMGDGVEDCPAEWFNFNTTP
jgi:hypothetical protein